MSVFRLCTFFAALSALLMTGAFAQGDKIEGEKIASQWCTRCHNIEPGGPFKLHPPSFASIAVYRSADQIHGRIMFPPFHSNMPQVGFILTPDNVDDIIAYIISLEPQ